MATATIKRSQKVKTYNIEAITGGMFLPGCFICSRSFILSCLLDKSRTHMIKLSLMTVLVWRRNYSAKWTAVIFHPGRIKCECMYRLITVNVMNS